MSGEVIEQHVVLVGTNAFEVATAVQSVKSSVDYPLRIHEHPTSSDYPETYGIWSKDGKSAIFGVSRLHRFKTGSFGADLMHIEPTDSYKIVFYQQGNDIDEDLLARTISNIQWKTKQERSLTNRLRRIATDVRWALTKAPVNFP